MELLIPLICLSGMVAAMGIAALVFAFKNLPGEGEMEKKDRMAHYYSRHFE